MRHLNPTRHTIGAVALAALVATGCSTPSLQADTASSASDPVALEEAEEAEDADRAESVDVEDVSPGETARDDTGPVVDDEREPTVSDDALPQPANPTGEPVVSIEGSPPFAGIDVLDLRRDGQTLTLEFAVHVGPSDGFITAQDWFAATEDTFLGARSQGNDPISTHDPVRRSVSGVTLVDRDNANRHLVLRDSSGACLCSSLPDGGLEAESTYRLSAQFPAPPAGVSSMTVEIPSFPSVDGVPIRDAN